MTFVQCLVFVAVLVLTLGVTHTRYGCVTRDARADPRSRNCAANTNTAIPTSAMIEVLNALADLTPTAPTP